MSHPIPSSVDDILIELVNERDLYQALEQGLARYVYTDPCEEHYKNFRRAVWLQMRNLYGIAEFGTNQQPNRTLLTVICERLLGHYWDHFIQIPGTSFPVYLDLLRSSYMEWTKNDLTIIQAVNNVDSHTLKAALRVFRKDPTIFNVEPPITKPEPEKEKTIMSKLNFDLPAVIKQTLVYGVVAKDASDAEIFGAIQRLENEITSLENIKTSSKAIGKKIAALKAEIAVLVEVVDTRD